MGVGVGMGVEAEKQNDESNFKDEWFFSVRGRDGEKGGIQKERQQERKGERERRYMISN